jgi:hypothetical protein
MERIAGPFFSTFFSDATDENRDRHSTGFGA